MRMRQRVLDRFVAITGVSMLWWMGCAAPANAASITYYADIFAGCDISTGTCSGTTATMTQLVTPTMMTIGAGNTISLPGFNPGWGTLTDVTVQLDAQIQATLKIVNPNGTSIGAYKGTMAIPVNISGNGVLAAETAATIAGFGSAIDGGANITHDILGSSTLTNNYTSIPANTTAYFYYSAGAQPSATNTQIKNTATGTSTSGGTYTGSDFVDYGADSNFYSTNNLSFTSDTSGATFGATFNGAGGATAGPNGTAGGILTVTYTYAEASAPEPATFLMLGSALVGLAWMLKRRRHKA